MTQFTDFKPAHAEQLITWFSNQQQLSEWAGRGVSYSDIKQAENLVEQLSIDDMPAFSLLNEGELLAFGQYYQRLDCCHLCRLAVAPSHRGKGLISTLIYHILEVGYKELSLNTASLFVYPRNESALKSYQKLGFNAEPYIGDDDIDDCLYMRRDGFPRL